MRSTNLYLSIDLETGGFDAKKHGVAEVAYVGFHTEQNVAVLDFSFQSTVLRVPGLLYEPQAESVHGITEEMQSFGVTEAYAFNMLDELIGGRAIVGKNFSFDARFIHEMELRTRHMEEDWEADYDVQDIWKKKTGKRESLEKICKALGIVYVPHRAFNDAWAAAQAFALLKEE